MTRLFRLLALLALLLAPTGMLGGHSAMAMPQHGAPMAMSHCDEQQQQPQDHRPQSMIDCLIACSAIAAAIRPFETPRLLPARGTFAAAPSPDIEGRRPDAATPPPRLV